MSDHDNTARPGRLSVTHRTVEGVRIVSLRGEIDHTSRDVLGEALLSGDTAVTRVVADLGGVSFMDSSGTRSSTSLPFPERYSSWLRAGTSSA
ncbi:STAS domain-containing protein, partial [Streptomyces sp. NPDC000963]